MENERLKNRIKARGFQSSKPLPNSGGDRIGKQDVFTTVSYEIFALFLNTIMIVDLLRKLSVGTGVVSVVRNVLYIGTFLFMVLHAIRTKNLLRPLLLTTAYVLLAALSLIINPELKSVIADGSLIFVTRCVTAFYFVLTLTDFELLWKKLRKYYLIVAVYCFFYISRNADAKWYESESYMTFSYNILYPTLLCLLMAIRKPNIWRIIGAVALAAIVLIYGARGPLVCIVMAVAIFLVFKLWLSTTKQRVISFVILLAVGTLLYIGRDWLIAQLESLTSSSRTLHMLFNNNLDSMSSRSGYRDTFSRYVEEHLVFPQGIYVDRKVLADLGTYENNYAHSFFWEILAQFGLVFGVLIFSALGIATLRGIARVGASRNAASAVFFATFFGCFVSFFLSSSYLINERAWCFFGILYLVNLQGFAKHSGEPEQPPDKLPDEAQRLKGSVS